MKLIYDASAGAGKTFTLAARYVALLVEDPYNYRRTLAVTFTNKATAEMKRRIVEYLFGLANGLDEAKGFLAVVSDLLAHRFTPDVISQRARESLELILADYQRFSVTTIDRFFMRVLRSIAHELHLNASMQVDLTNTDVIDEAVNELVSELTPDDAELLPWLREQVNECVAEGKHWDVRDNIKDLAKACLYEEKYLRRRLDERNKPFDYHTVGTFKREIQRLKDAKLKALAQEGKELLEIVGLYSTYISYSDNYRRVAQKAIEGDTKELPDNKTLTKYLTPEKIIKKSSHPDAQVAMDAVSERLRRIHETLSCILNAEIPLSKIPLAAAFGKIAQKVKSINDANNRFPLSHTQITLRTMSQAEAPFVYEKMGCRYTNVMIDEFQDTSCLQWDNFRTLLDSVAEQGGLHMLVGDLKQSIYRFRNGDYRLLLAEKANTAKNKVITLADNYRSLPTVVDFNNEFFAQTAALLNLSDIYDSVRQTPKRKGEGYVRVRLDASGDDVTKVYADILEQIHTLHNDFHVPYGKMAMLGRYNKDLKPIIDYIATNDPTIKMVSDEAFVLGSSQICNLIVASLEYVLLPSKDAQRSVSFSVLMDHDGALVDALDQRRNEISDLPLYEQCARKLGLLATTPDGQDAYEMTYSRSLLDFADRHGSNPRAFVDHWKNTMCQTSIPAAEADGIRLMTIHKAKGLQRHTVLVPVCDWKLQATRSNEYIWTTPKGAPFDKIGSIPVSLSQKMQQTEVYCEAYQEEMSNRRIDEFNSLYVALTRAENDLLVWGQQKGTNPTDCASLLARYVGHPSEGQPAIYVKGAMHAYEEAIEKAKPNKMTPHVVDVPVSMIPYENKREFRRSQPAVRFAETSAESRRRQQCIDEGILGHLVFSRMRTTDDLDEALRSLVLEHVLTQEQADSFGLIISKALENEQAAQWFAPGWRILAEQAIVGAPGDVHSNVPDRVMIRDGRLVVVDYKFGLPHADHRQQVKR